MPVNLPSVNAALPVIFCSEIKFCRLLQNTDNRVVTLEGSHIRYDNDTDRDIWWKFFSDRGLIFL